MESERKDYWGILRWERELAMFWERTRESEESRGKRRTVKDAWPESFDGDLLPLEKQEPLFKDRP